MAEQTETVRKILTYLGNRPGKEDTLEGITGWWTKTDRGSHGVDEVLNALKLLIEKGDIEEVKISRDVVVYRAGKKQNA
ncbi:MAG: hypothetical protein OEW04_12890 [Nitrospirota bacterium]|nr:hypothetical protein [Nitrospirota bacterium]